MSESDLAGKAMEAALAGLRPTSRLDRDRLLYLAGQAAGGPATSPAVGRWRASCLISTAIAASLAAALFVERRERADLLAAAAETKRTLAEMGLVRADSDRMHPKSPGAAAPLVQELQISPAAARGDSLASVWETTVVSRHVRRIEVALAEESRTTPPSSAPAAPGLQNAVNTREALLLEIDPRLLMRSHSQRPLF